MPEESISPLFALTGSFITMIALLALSAFCSASEAALFSISWKEQRSLNEKRKVESIIKGLLTDSNRLLSAILLWNLATNMAYFTLAGALTTKIAAGASNDYLVGILALVSLLLLIAFGELIPKSVGVSAPMAISRIVAIPLYWMVRVIDPIAPIMQWTCEFLRRLIWPGMKAEESLETIDLERAVELSSGDSALVEHEKAMLQNVIQLSVIRAAEWMRPRSAFRVISRKKISNLNEHLKPTASDEPEQYVLVGSDASEELIGAIRLDDLPFQDKIDGQRWMQPLLIAAWCEPLSRVFQQMQKTGRRAAAVVNERGEAIGIVTHDDLIEAMFRVDRTETLGFSQPAFTQTGDLQWEVTGSTSLRRIELALGRKLPSGRYVTMAGLVQNQLRRLPRVGDLCTWDRFSIEVLEAPRRGEMLLRMTTQTSEMDLIEIEDDT